MKETQVITVDKLIDVIHEVPVEDRLEGCTWCMNAETLMDLKAIPSEQYPGIFAHQNPYLMLLGFPVKIDMRLPKDEINLTLDSACSLTEQDT